jgi:hypothetical protein
VRYYPIPLELAEANAAVENWHRHHQPALNHRFSIGVIDGEGVLHGAAISGRPVARLGGSPRDVIEVLRVATDGTENCCSILYAAAARTARGIGYRRIQTYTLGSEPGTSLIAAGWTCEGEAGGGSWSREDRPRIDDQRGPQHDRRRGGGDAADSGGAGRGGLRLRPRRRGRRLLPLDQAALYALAIALAHLAGPNAAQQQLDLELPVDVIAQAITTAGRLFCADPTLIRFGYRTQPHLDARHVAIHAAHLCGISYAGIGRALGQDHTTAMNRLLRHLAAVLRSPRLRRGGPVRVGSLAGRVRRDDARAVRRGAARAHRRRDAVAQHR